MPYISEVDHSAIKDIDLNFSAWWCCIIHTLNLNHLLLNMFQMMQLVDYCIFKLNLMHLFLHIAFFWLRRKEGWVCVMSIMEPCQSAFSLSTFIFIKAWPVSKNIMLWPQHQSYISSDHLFPLCSFLICVHQTLREKYDNVDPALKYALCQN